MELITKDIGNYIVYSDGRIWSKYNKNFMKPAIDGNGYLRTIIYSKSIKVHRLVAETFIPNPDNLPFIDHINNDKTDNRVENLRWCTPKENINWAYDDELISILKGEDVYNSKLKESEVMEIYTNPNKLSQKKLAIKFNVSAFSIGEIQNNKTWTHITKDLVPGHRNKPGDNQYSNTNPLSF